jgi:hypothetical protein
MKFGLQKAQDDMFLMTFFRFTSVILPLDMSSFMKICIAILLGGKRLV